MSTNGRKAGRKAAATARPGKAWRFKPGPDPRRGHGPPKGSGGRPRNEFRQMMRELGSGDAVIARLQDILLNSPDQLMFLRAHQHVVEHGYGKAIQPTTIGVGDAESAALGELRALTDEQLLEHFRQLRAQISQPPRD